MQTSFPRRVLNEVDRNKIGSTGLPFLQDVDKSKKLKSAQIYFLFQELSEER
jgi:hypothetical protein